MKLVGIKDCLNVVSLKSNKENLWIKFSFVMLKIFKIKLLTLFSV